VGSHLVRRLAQERIQTRCLVRRTSDIEKFGTEVAYGYVTDRESLKKPLQAWMAVIRWKRDCDS
jgi:hypothetical protein